MTTKLYFHDAANALSGTFPTGEQSSSTPSWSATGATTLRTMSTTKGVLQASLTGTTLASTSGQKGFFGFFCSPPLNGAQSVGTANTLDFTIALSESNLNANVVIGGINIYVWRPTTGAVVGSVIDSFGFLGGLEPSAASSEQVNSYTAAGGDNLSLGLSVSAADGDVIVCEIWTGTIVQAMATAYTATIFYDGTTESTTENAVVSNHAGYIQFAETLAFKGAAAVLTAAVGSFTLSGQAAGLKRGLKVTAAAGSFALSGQAATLTHGYRLVAAAGAFTLSGQTATLTATRKVIAAVGAFVLSGQPAALKYGRRLTAAVGAFTLSGQDAGLKYGRKVIAAVGSFTLTGKDATLTKAGGAALSLTAGAGSFTFTGQDATLTKSGVPGPTVYYQGAGHPGKHRRKRIDLFDSIEATLRESVYGPEEAEPTPEPAVLEAVAQLEEISQGNADLLERLAVLKAELADYRKIQAEKEKLKRLELLRQQEEDDEEAWLMVA